MIIHTAYIPTILIIEQAGSDFKGSRYTAEYFEVSHKNPLYFPYLSLSIYAHLGVFKNNF